MNGMRSTLLVALLVAVAAAASAETERDIKAGFRDMSLGDPITKLEGRKCDPPNQILNSTWQSCQRSSDRLRIGDVALTEIRYVFLADQLWYVVFSAEGGQCNDLLSTIRTVYGKPTWDRSERIYAGARAATNIGYEDEETRLMCVDQQDNQTCGCDIRSRSLQSRYTDMKRREAVGDL